MQNLQAHAPGDEGDPADATRTTRQRDERGDEAKGRKKQQINPAAPACRCWRQFPVFIGLFFVLKDFEKEIVNLPQFQGATTSTG